MKHVHGISGAALILLIGLIVTGCSPKEEAAAPSPAGSTTGVENASSAQPAKLETATLKAVGMT